MTLSEIIPPLALLMPPAVGAAAGHRTAGISGASIGLLVAFGLGVFSFLGVRRLRLDGPASLLLFPWLVLVAVVLAFLLSTLFPHSPAYSLL